MSEAPDEKMLRQLRALEVKMGLVLTLVRMLQSIINTVPLNMTNTMRSIVQGVGLGCYQ